MANPESQTEQTPDTAKIILIETVLGKALDLAETNNCIVHRKIQGMRTAKDLLMGTVSMEVKSVYQTSCPPCIEPVMGLVRI